MADLKIKSKAIEAVSKIHGIVGVDNRIVIDAPTKGRAITSSQDKPISEPPVALPKSELKELTPTEQTDLWKHLIRFEINGDVGRIIDTTFDYPKSVVQLEAEFDKCLDEERFKDGEKVVDEIIGLLRVKHTGSEIMLGEHPAKCTPHVLLKAWDEELTLCRRAADGEFGGGPSRHRSLAFARLKQVRDMAATLKATGPTYVLKSDRGRWYEARPDRNPSSLAYLLLRSLRLEERQVFNGVEEMTKAMDTVATSVSVLMPVLDRSVDACAYVHSTNFHLSKLGEAPLDAMFCRDIKEYQGASPDRMWTMEPMNRDMPIRRSQLGTRAEALKRKDQAVQSVVDSTVRQLFPSETIEIHVVRDTVILRGTIKLGIHVQQILDVTRSMASNVLNQMTVRSAPDSTSTVIEHLEPIGKDPHGLREIFAESFPNEHIEAHFLPGEKVVVISSDRSHAELAPKVVVLRGHLSRAELAPQVVEIARKVYPNVLYQMTPPLPTNDLQELGKSSDPVMTIVLKHANANELAPLLQKKWAGKGEIRADDHTNLLRVSALPKVLAEIQTSIQTLDKPESTGKQDVTLSADSMEAELSREALQLARKYREARLDDQPALRRELEKLTERHFDQRQQRRRREIDDLSQRVDKLRVTQQRRQENRSVIINQRVQDLLDPNSDLRWEEPQVTKATTAGSPRKMSPGLPDMKPVQAGTKVLDTEEASSADGGTTASPARQDKNPPTATVDRLNPLAPSAPEPTFDGTLYSQWLKMLETERKPEKLAAAMEACSRLVAPGDEQRVFRGVIAGLERFRDSNDMEESSLIQTSTCRSVFRMMLERGPIVSDAIADELLTLVSDPQAMEANCDFVKDLLAELKPFFDKKPLLSLQKLSPQFIAAIVQQCGTSQNVGGNLGTVATAFWILSQKPIDDFEGLRPVVLQEVEFELKQQYQRYGTGREFAWWQSVVTTDRVSQTPEFASLLAKHLASFERPEQIIEILTSLGPIAKSTVPNVLEFFLTRWNTQEKGLRDLAAGSGTHEPWDSLLTETLIALTRIGPNSTQAVPLLRELTSIAPLRDKNFDPEKYPTDRFWNQLKKSRRIIDTNPTSDLPDSKPLLSDFAHMTGTWKLIRSRPGKTIPNLFLYTDSGFLLFGEVSETLHQEIGFPNAQPHFTIDEASKQISLFDKKYPDYKQFGIYELEGDRLKIELTRPGNPSPTKFSPDPDNLPAGRIFFEFQRHRGEKP